MDIVSFQVAGKNINISNESTILQSATISKSMVELVGTFSMTINSIFDKNGFYEVIIKPDDKIDIFVNNKLILSALAEGKKRTNFPSVETISGRTITGKIIDSTAKAKQYSERNFKKLIELILKDNNFPQISVINEVANIKDLTADIDVTIDKNDTIFNAIDRLATILSVLLITDKNGNIVITREGINYIKHPLISNIINPQDNNCSAFEDGWNSTKRYRFVEINSQSDGAVDAAAFYEDKTVRYPTRKAFSYKMGVNNTTYDVIAEWKAKRLKAESESLSLTVQGFYADAQKKILWEVNSRVDIQCDAYGWNKIMLITAVEHNFSATDGFKTTLTFAPVGVFGFASEISEVGASGKISAIGFEEIYTDWELPNINDSTFTQTEFVVKGLTTDPRDKGYSQITDIELERLNTRLKLSNFQD